ncbi:MAG: cytochrome c [Moraxellaceae bacterium]|nr:cytochrome c [Moraxellaceae bacterium]
MKNLFSRPWLRLALIGLGILIALVAMLVGIGLILAQHKADRRMHVAVAAIDVPDDDKSRARGRYLYESRGCADCHAADGGGRVFVDAGDVFLAGPDITGGGRSARYRSQDWVRAVRHGLAPGGRPLRVMPSEDYNRLTDVDLASIVAYVRSLPPRDGAAGELRLPLPARVLYGFGVLDDAADRIDHSLPPEAPVAEAASVAHGRYVAQLCVACHGPGFSGGKIPGAPPDWPASANLTPGEGGVMARYGDAQAFAKMMRGGKRPDGSAITVMPFEALAKMNDTDLEAMRLYLATLPARPAGSR